MAVVELASTPYLPERVVDRLKELRGLQTFDVHGGEYDEMSVMPTKTLRFRQEAEIRAVVVKTKGVSREVYLSEAKARNSGLFWTGAEWTSTLPVFNFEQQ
jgi:hypothetical protein